MCGGAVIDADQGVARPGCESERTWGGVGSGRGRSSYPCRAVPGPALAQDLWESAMPIKTILACTNEEDTVETLLGAAAALARRFEAHLICDHVMEALIVHTSVAMYMPDPVHAEFNTAQMERAEKIEAAVKAKLQAETFAWEWRSERAASMTSAEHAVASARAADLVVAALSSPDKGRSDAQLILERVIRESGRPVLTLPHGYDGDVPGEKVLVGWSPTREATRAVHDAMDLMAPGAQVTLLCVDREGAPDRVTQATAEELAAALDRCGFRVDVSARPTAQRSVGQVLLQEAFERGADLMVTGAYGHSPFYDFVIGAVTNEVMAEAKLPVLFSK